MLKAVILIGGPLKGTRFRPLSFDMPKPLFPVAGLPMIQHHIEAFARIPELKEIIIMGYYAAGDLSQFVSDMNDKYKVGIRYLQEFTPLGTGGGLYHFRDQIRCGNPSGFFVVNGDVCADFQVQAMLEDHRSRGDDALITVMTTEANKQQAVSYGCVARHPTLGHMTHYVEKPSTFVSPLINCGVYFCSMGIFENLGNVFNQKLSLSDEDNEMKEKGVMQLEQDVLTPLAGSGRAFVFVTTRWWSQLKSAGAAIYANRHYLQLYRHTLPERLSSGDNVVGDVHIHRSASVHPTALIGPNVTIGAGAVIGSGVRLKDSIILDGASVGSHTLVLNSIVGRNVKIGSWTRVEGTPCDPNPDKPFAKMDNLPLFNKDGRLNPSITVLGCSVKVPSEVILLNSIVLPYKELTRSFKYEIIL